MKIIRTLAVCCAMLPLAVTQLVAHEFWIEPENFQPEAGQEVRADLKNGQNFKGAPLSWFDRRNVRVEVRRDGEPTKMSGRAGDIPALRLSPEEDGLITLVHQSAPTLLTYDNWDTVLAFTAHKDFPWFSEQHLARDLPKEAVRESYTRFSKSLVGVGDGTGADDAAGLLVEFVALTNPYTDDLTGGFRAQVLYQGTAQANLQVEVFEKAGDGHVIIDRLRTDAEGIVTVPVRPGHRYLLDHVVLREPEPGTETADQAMWESLWASLTFAVPLGE